MAGRRVSTSPTDSLKYVGLSWQPHVRPGSWVEIGGDFKLPSDIKEIKIYIQIAEPEVNYFFDDGSLVELLPDPDWRATAEKNIDVNRKVKLAIITRKKKNISLQNFTIEVEQRRSEFGHGTAVKASLWTDAAYGFYKDFVYNTLKSEWAVIENALKWRGMEWTQGNLRFDDANATIDDLLSNGVSVRGHNMFWGVEKWVPSWVQSITDKEVMKATIQERISNTIAITKGRLAHWDVNNEALHDDFYERKTGNVNITMDMFRDMNAEESNTKLFLNDFAVVNSAPYTTAITNQAKSFLDAQVPIHGVGVQSHLPSSDIDITQLKYRLDKIAEAGLPIWVTEMSVTDTNDTAKAQAIEDALTLYFSHKMVKGVLLWGFWSEAIYNRDNSLATGTDSITLNEAGQKYVDLVNTAWRTNWTAKLKSYKNKRYFKGDYSIKVKKNGVTLKTTAINLTSNRKLILRVKGTTDSPKIKVKIR
ncbi:anti-sigma-I factor RsgI6-like isoform X2 [Pecten maximus]|uniref:anti-sigma-I factor RsgI6-like isoform X2 n=1 Tax=Pecten maximus TaxID=6579 RepID=UPI001458B495|nr:anti-sigma-I factor RsgI6-like isoform X2 [Pecten maximus]